MKLFLLDFTVCTVTFYCITLLFVSVLAKNESAGYVGYDKESTNNNAMVNEWYSDDDGGFYDAVSLYLNETTLDDDSEDDVEGTIKSSSGIVKGHSHNNTNNSPWVVCIVGTATLPVHKNFICGCGGSIIGSKHVLSAAHCVRKCTHDKCKFRSKRYYVVAGERFPRESVRFEEVKSFHFINKPPGTTKTKVDRTSCFTNDIVVLELKRPIHFRKGVNIIQLPPPASYDSKIGKTTTTRLVRQNAICRVYGWGMDGGTKAGLKSVLSQLIDCDYQSVEEKTCPRTIICTHQYAKIGSPCHGDSGGPLVCNGILHGVVSAIWGECTEPNIQLYHRVEVFVTWIKQVISMKHLA